MKEARESETRKRTEKEKSSSEASLGQKFVLLNRQFMNYLQCCFDGCQSADFTPVLNDYIKYSQEIHCQHESIAETAAGKREASVPATIAGETYKNSLYPPKGIKTFTALPEPPIQSTEVSILEPRRSLFDQTPADSVLSEKNRPKFSAPEESASINRNQSTLFGEQLPKPKVAPFIPTFGSLASTSAAEQSFVGFHNVTSTEDLSKPRDSWPQKATHVTTDAQPTKRKLVSEPDAGGTQGFGGFTFSNDHSRPEAPGARATNVQGKGFDGFFFNQASSKRSEPSSLFGTSSKDSQEIGTNTLNPAIKPNLFFGSNPLGPNQSSFPVSIAPENTFSAATSSAHVPSIFSSFTAGSSGAPPLPQLGANPFNIPPSSMPQSTFAQFLHTKPTDSSELLKDDSDDAERKEEPELGFEPDAVCSIPSRLFVINNKKYVELGTGVTNIKKLENEDNQRQVVFRIESSRTGCVLMNIRVERGGANIKQIDEKNMSIVSAPNPPLSEASCDTIPDGASVATYLIRSRNAQDMKLIVSELFP